MLADANPTSMHRVPGCELCEGTGGATVWNQRDWRVVRVDDEAFPAFYRVICNHHVAEFSELLAHERQRCMNLVCAVERVLIEHLQPTKVNLASLGNMTPHLHWHVIARFAWDSHFPQPIWGQRQRELLVADPAGRLAVPLEALDRLMAEALSAL